jgi:hypothetical protein
LLAPHPPSSQAHARYSAPWTPHPGATPFGEAAPFGEETVTPTTRPVVPADWTSGADTLHKAKIAAGDCSLEDENKNLAEENKRLLLFLEHQARESATERQKLLASETKIRELHYCKNATMSFSGKKIISE